MRARARAHGGEGERASPTSAAPSAFKHNSRQRRLVTLCACGSCQILGRDTMGQKRDEHRSAENARTRCGLGASKMCAVEMGRWALGRRNKHAKENKRTMTREHRGKHKHHDMRTLRTHRNEPCVEATHFVVCAYGGRSTTSGAHPATHQVTDSPRRGCHAARSAEVVLRRAHHLQGCRYVCRTSMRQDQAMADTYNALAKVPLRSPMSVPW